MIISENLKKYDSLTDNLKSRDASASKNEENQTANFVALFPDHYIMKSCIQPFITAVDLA